MNENFQSISEIVTGLAIKGRISPDVIKADDLFPPYDAIVKLLKKGKEAADIIMEVGTYPFEAASMAASSINGTKVNWLEVLEKSKLKQDVSKQLAKYSKLLEKGQDIDIGKLKEELYRLETVETRVQSIFDIQPDTMPFMPSGWDALDDHLLGIPKHGLITVGANPKVGKTSFLMKLTSKFAQKHPDKKVFIASLEMTAPEYKDRLNSIIKIDDDTQKRMLVFDEIADINKICNMSASIDDVGMVGIDFADLLIEGDTSESEMGKIYRACAKLAKNLSVPVVLLSQLARFQTGLPRPNNLRYSGMAEALSWMVLMLYNPITDYMARDQEKISLPTIPGSAYVLSWLIRGGFRLHDMDSPGAIAIPWKGKTGWADQARKWYTLAGD